MRAWLVIIGVVAGCLFAWQIYVVMQLKEDAAVLDAKMKRSQNAFSDENVSSYMQAVFDGVTFGKFADEGIFTVVKRMARKGDAQEEMAVRISVKYETAKTIRNYSLGVCCCCMLLAVVWPVRRRQ